MAAVVVVICRLTQLTRPASSEKFKLVVSRDEIVVVPLEETVSAPLPTAKD